MNEKLKKQNRLRKDKDFEILLSSKSRLRQEGITVVLSRNGLTFSRLGVRVSKQTGNAVRRSYLRRCVKEIFRRELKEMICGYDLAVFLTKSFDFQQLRERLTKMVALLKQEKENRC